jgi:hypothetical protein
MKNFMGFFLFTKFIIDNSDIHQCSMGLQNYITAMMIFNDLGLILGALLIVQFTEMFFLT